MAKTRAGKISPQTLLGSLFFMQSKKGKKVGLDKTSFLLFFLQKEGAAAAKWVYFSRAKGQKRFIINQGFQVDEAFWYSSSDTTLNGVFGINS